MGCPGVIVDLFLHVYVLVCLFTFLNRGEPVAVRRLKRPMDDIKNASELVNSVLVARGYNTDRLLFPSIDTVEDAQGNDKAVLNTIYALLQELDKSQNERAYLNEVLRDKNEIIKHFEDSNTELNSATKRLQRELQSNRNEVELLNQRVKAIHRSRESAKFELVKERNVVNSLKTKYDTDMRRKTVIIEQLQDKLLSKRRKFFSVMNDNNFAEDSPPLYDSKIQLDRELESMMVNLSDLIDKITFENSSSVKLLNFVVGYLTVLSNYKKHDTTSNVPPSPNFFFENLERERQDADKSTSTTHIRHLTNSSNLEKTLIEQLNKLYEGVTMDFMISERESKSLQSSKVVQLQQTVEQLQKNLDSAIETNEEWRRKFDGIQRKSNPPEQKLAKQ